MKYYYLKLMWFRKYVCNMVDRSLSVALKLRVLTFHEGKRRRVIPHPMFLLTADLLRVVVPGIYSQLATAEGECHWC